VPDRDLDNIIKQYPYFTIDEIEGEIPYHPKENLHFKIFSKEKILRDK
jgi:hypothetical protein